MLTRMGYVAAVLFVLAGLLHVAIFWMESVAWTRPTIWRRFGLTSQADADTTRPMAFNQGFYNLFLAVGTLVGVGLLSAHGNAHAAGVALVVMGAGSMVLAAAVLLSTGAKYLRPALTQATLPLLGLLAGLIALL